MNQDLGVIIWMLIAALWFIIAMTDLNCNCQENDEIQDEIQEVLDEIREALKDE